MSITLFNKAVFSVYRFPYPNLVTTLQILISLVYMWLLSWGKCMYIEAISWDKAQQVICPFTRLNVSEWFAVTLPNPA